MEKESSTVNSFFAWVENSVVSTAVRESDSILGIPALLVLHVIGMGFFAGTNAAIDLRILGVGKSVPLRPMKQFFPLLWFALAVSLLSGLLLMIAYPTKALTNPIFYTKMLCITLGLILLRLIRKEIFSNPHDDGTPAIRRNVTILAGLSLGLWVAAIAAGRLLAYTYKWEMVGIPAIL